MKMISLQIINIKIKYEIYFHIYNVIIIKKYIIIIIKLNMKI